MSGTLPDRANALLAMTLDGADDRFAPTRLECREAVSEPYEVVLSAVAAQAGIAPTEVLHKQAQVRLQRAGGEVERRFNGWVREFVPTETGFRGMFGYRMVLVPRLWSMTLATDCRVFQRKTTRQILTTLFSEAGVAQPTFRLAGEDPELEYRTQFNESALRFATRLMEEAGWFYFFEQGANGETVVVADSNQNLTDLGPLPSSTQGGIAAVRPLHGVARGTERTKDYDPVAPTKDVSGEQATALATKGALSRDAFLWPAGTDDPAVASARARRRMEAAEAAAGLLEGEGDWGAVAPGHALEVPGDHPSLAAGRYGVRMVAHSARDEGWLTGAGAPHYANRFELFPAATAWRQPLATARPRMVGVHAALVIGASGDGEISTDDLARVKVRFFWDHREETSGEQAVWARVVQPWAGGGWGGQFVPRVGTEVAVAFMDGDPDRPVVLGGLYNGNDVAIFPKAEKMKSGFRTRSADQGGTEQFSEFSFDDTKDSEVVFLHAQKDLKVEVENDQTLTVDNCRIVTVKVDETVDVKGKQTIAVKGDRALTVQQGNYTLKVGQGNSSETVSLGNWTLKAEAGSVTIEAMQGITLKVGGNSVKITQDGIAVEGIMVKVKGSAMADLGAPMTTVKGDGMLTLKGGITMIN